MVLGCFGMVLGGFRMDLKFGMVSGCFRMVLGCSTLGFSTMSVQIMQKGAHY